MRMSTDRARYRIVSKAPASWWLITSALGFALLVALVAVLVLDGRRREREDAAGRAARDAAAEVERLLHRGR